MNRNSFSIPEGAVTPYVRCPNCQSEVRFSLNQFGQIVNDTSIDFTNNNLLNQINRNETILEEVSPYDTGQQINGSSNVRVYPKRISIQQISSNVVHPTEFVNDQHRNEQGVYTIPTTVPLNVPLHINDGSVYQPNNIDDEERTWQFKFPRGAVKILSIIEIVLTLIIFIREIVSLSLISSEQSGAGIWCSIPFLLAAILTFILVHKKNCSRIWSTRVLFTQIDLLIFTFILIGITATYIQTYQNVYSYLNNSPYSGSISSLNQFKRKYQIIQSELAFAILLMFSGFIYICIYIYVTYTALWKHYQSLRINHHLQQTIHF